MSEKIYKIKKLSKLLYFWLSNYSKLFCVLLPGARDQTVIETRVYKTQNMKTYSF